MMDKDYLLNSGIPQWSELSCNAHQSFDSPFTSMISSTTTFTAVSTTTVAASSYMLPNNNSCCNSTSTSSLKLHSQNIKIANMGNPVPLPTTTTLPPFAAGPGFPARPFKNFPSEKSPVSEQIPHQETCSNAMNIRKRKMKADGRISAKEFAGDKAREGKWNEKEYIHVRARRGEATDRHSVAERARRENINKKMKLLQDLVPGCNKAIGKAVMLDETINYVESLQRQVQFLSMKLAAVNPGLSFKNMYCLDSEHRSENTNASGEPLRQSSIDPVHIDDPLSHNLGVQLSSVDGFTERLQQFPEEDDLHSIIQNRVNFCVDNPTWEAKGWL